MYFDTENSHGVIRLDQDGIIIGREFEFRLSVDERAGLLTASRALRRPMNVEELKPLDSSLASNLVSRGDSHAKFSRLLTIYGQMTFPRYWWTDMVTYRHGFEKVCESTMHRKLTSPFTKEDFECQDISDSALEELNVRRDQLRDGKITFPQYKRVLPEGFMMTCDFFMNYQMLRHVWLDRRNHKLLQFQALCDWIELQPFFETCIRGSDK